MKVWLVALAGLFSISFFVSCQKEVDGTLPEGIVNDSIYISKYVELDSVFPSGVDTTFKVLFTYDNVKRLKRTVSISNIPGAASADTTDFFYNGNDTLPYKTTTISISQFSVDVDTGYYEFSNGRLSKDSSIVYSKSPVNQFILTSVIHYQLLGNNVFINYKEYDLPGIISPSDQWSGLIKRTLQNGNIIKQVDTSTYNTMFTPYDDLEANYDNKVNPFYKNRFEPNLLSKDCVQKNNVLQCIGRNRNGNIELQYTTTYIYREDGYPISSITVYPANSTIRTQVYYFYTN